MLFTSQEALIRRRVVGSRVERQPGISEPEPEVRGSRHYAHG